MSGVLASEHILIKAVGSPLPARPAPAPFQRLIRGTLCLVPRQQTTNESLSLRSRSPAFAGSLLFRSARLAPGIHSQPPSSSENEFLPLPSLRSNPVRGGFSFLSLRSACALGSDFNSSSAGFSRIKICPSAPAFSCSLRVLGDAPLPSAKPACTQPCFRRLQQSCAPAGFAPIRSAWCCSPGSARLRSAALPSVDSASASFLVSGRIHFVPCSVVSPAFADLRFCSAPLQVLFPRLLRRRRKITFRSAQFSCGGY